MTGLFDKVKVPVVSSVEVAKEVIIEKPVLEAEPSPSQNLQGGGFGVSPLDDDDGISFGGEKSPTDAILEMSGDDEVFAVKGVTPFPPAFMAAQVQADYHEELFGKDNIVSSMLRAVCVWSSRYNSSRKGDRAKLMFSALGSAKQDEFLLEKETKGLLKR